MRVNFNVILSEVKDLNTQTTAFEILRFAQNDKMLDLTHPQNFASLHRLHRVSLGFEQLQQAAGAGQMAGAYHE